MATGRESFTVDSGLLPGASTLIDNYTTYRDGGLVEIGAFGRATVTALVADVIDRTVLGRRSRLYDGELFGVILVIPRVKNLGPIVSETTFQIEVWNADDYPHTGLSYTITGSSGVTLENGVVMPAAWAPFSSVFFDAVVDDVGDPVLSTIVTFVFPGFTGTDCQILGFRVAIYPLAPDWSKEFSERYGFGTEVIRAREGSEQRILQRGIPEREVSYTGFCPDAATAAEIMTKLFIGGNYLFAVPYWPDAVKPSANVAIGATVISVDTTTRIFEDGGLLVLWQSERVWEAIGIETVTATTITVASPVSIEFPASSSLVIPLLVARPTSTPVVNNVVPGKSEITATFVSEPV